MPGDMFDQISSVETLTAGWGRVRRNGGSAGGDGVTTVMFRQDAERRIAGLSRALREGAYQPGTARCFRIRKKDGGRRLLRIPCVVDRIAQTAAHMVLSRVIDPELEDSSFAYRPGRGVADAIRRIAAFRDQGFEWVAEGDIRQFFDTIPHAALLARLRESIDDDRVIALIAVWLADGGAQGVGVPQGAPISPLLANLFLDRIDEMIETPSLKLVRFADDFVLLARSEADATAALERMADLLSGEGLDLHRGKTRIVHFAEGFRFLGHLFARSVVLSLSGEVVDIDPAEQDEEEVPGEQDAPNGVIAADSNPRRPTAWSASGTIDALYILRPGLTLHAVRRGFRVIDGGREAAQLPSAPLKRIEVAQGAEITDAAIRLAANSGIRLDFTTRSGRSIARVVGSEAGRAVLHLSQAAICLDPERRVSLARVFAHGRMVNQRALLKRLNRRRKNEKIDRAAMLLTREIRKIRTAGSLNTTRGHEGAAAAVYWPALGRCLTGEWKFDVRRRRPPPPSAARSSECRHIISVVDAVARGRIRHDGCRPEYRLRGPPPDQGSRGCRGLRPRGGVPCTTRRSCGDLHVQHKGAHG